jgi:hypothetical protein
MPDGPFALQAMDRGIRVPRVSETVSTSSGYSGLDELGGRTTSSHCWNGCCVQGRTVGPLLIHYVGRTVDFRRPSSCLPILKSASSEMEADMKATLDKLYQLEFKRFLAGAIVSDLLRSSPPVWLTFHLDNLHTILTRSPGDLSG